MDYKKKYDELLETNLKMEKALEEMQLKNNRKGAEHRNI